MRSSAAKALGAVCMIVAVVATGCGSAAGPAATTPATAVTPTVTPSTPATVHTMDLSITVGSNDGPTLATATLRVTADGAAVGSGYLSHPDAAAAAVAAVAAPAARTRLMHGEQTGQACTEIFGGPDIATVTGTLGGADVSTLFHRENGCGIADWTLLEPLLGRPRWNVDSRVLQPDESGLQLATGESFAIELPSNATTGYAWVATVSDDTVVTAADHVYIDPTTTAMGAGGWERFTYRAGAPGTATVQFEYRRSFEPDAAPAATASFTITVTAAATVTTATG